VEIRNGCAIKLDLAFRQLSDSTSNERGKNWTYQDLSLPTNTSASTSTATDTVYQSRHKSRGSEEGIDKREGREEARKERRGKEEKPTNPRSFFIPKHTHFQTLITPSISQYRFQLELPLEPDWW